MTRIRHGERIWEIHDEEWPRWVRLGWIPPDAMVLSERWTKGVWRQADSLEVYHLFRPSPRELATEPVREQGVRRHGPFGIFRGPGPSVTELLIIANILVGLFLYLRWGESYGTRIWEFSAALKGTLESGGVHVLFVPLFLHADFAHISSNMLSFVLAGAVIEEFYGRARMLAIYIGAGLSGALLSLLREKDVLSVGASGAILGMYGAGLVFLLRERRHFSERQKFRLRRVQIPFFALLVVPAILHADFYSHLGGFLGGIALGWLLPPLADRLPRPVHLPVDDETGRPDPRVTGEVRPPTAPSPVPSSPGASGSRIIPFPVEQRLDQPPAGFEHGGRKDADSSVEGPDQGPARGPDR